MNRRTFCKISSAIIAGALGLHNRAYSQEIANPNILIIVADDLGWADVGYHGSEIKTPNIDKLVDEGIELERYYVSPVCSPSRAALLTGRHPLRYGMQSGVCNPATTHGMPPKEITLAEMLAEAGYKHRGCFGKWHLGLNSLAFDPLSQGFTYFYGHYNGALDYFTHKRCGELDWHKDRQACYDEGYTTDLIGCQVIEFIENSADNGPFFAYVAFNAPHSPMQAKRQYLDQYGFDSEMTLMKNSSKKRGIAENQPDYGQKGRGNNVRQTFSAMVASMDEQIGNILKTLDENNLHDNTLILFQSDNGATTHFGGSNIPLRGGKFTLWEGGVRVPAVIRWPARFKGGQKQSGVIGCVDIWPTLAAIVGIEKQDSVELDGNNMLTVLEGKSLADPGRILYLGDKTAVMQRWKLTKGQLFDLDSDPYEKHDVASQHPKIVKHLTAFIQEIESKAGPKCNLGPEKQKGWKPPKNWKLPTE